MLILIFTLGLSVGDTIGSDVNCNLKEVELFRSDFFILRHFVQ